MGEAKRRVLDKKKKKKEEKTTGVESKRTPKGTERFVCFLTKTRTTPKKKRDENRARSFRTRIIVRIGGTGLDSFKEGTEEEDNGQRKNKKKGKWAGVMDTTKEGCVAKIMTMVMIGC